MCPGFGPEASGPAGSHLLIEKETKVSKQISLGAFCVPNLQNRTNPVIGFIAYHPSRSSLFFQAVFCHLLQQFLQQSQTTAC